MTASDFERWKQDPVTVAVFESLLAEKRELEEVLHSGACMGANVEEIAIRYAQWTGERKGYERALNHVPAWARREEDEDVR